MFEAFPKIARLSRDIVVTEKLDGTNAQVLVTEDGQVLAGSRSKMITVDDDNFGFARWVAEHATELRDGLGVGRHFGEWWGSGIQRGYGLKEKRFSLFNVARWTQDPARITEKRLMVPECCSVVPVLYDGLFMMEPIEAILDNMRRNGSVAVWGFMKPEGIVIYHTASKTLFKKTLEKDDAPKGREES